jgi:hypothetical protein
MGRAHTLCQQSTGVTAASWQEQHWTDLKEEEKPETKISHRHALPIPHLPKINL